MNFTAIYRCWTGTARQLANLFICCRWIRNPLYRSKGRHLIKDSVHNLYDELAWLKEEGELKVGKEGIVDSIHYEISNINDKIIKVKIRNIKVKARGHEN